jgi:hypothetical protein
LQAFAELKGMPAIPAMTTDAERQCYYRLAREHARRGEVVELGAWLGASSAWIAAGMRDSGTVKRAKVYDRFEAKAPHADKVKRWCAAHGVAEVAKGTPFDQFKVNLGPLLKYVEPVKAEIGSIRWGDNPVAVLICDAPKRVREVSAVLTNFRHGLQPSSVMAWQDFCHFPSYEIPACLYRVRHHLEFVEAVVPGTTMVFRVKSQWKAHEVSQTAFDLGTWTVESISAAWSYWQRFVAEEKRPLFRCGAALFMCDIGEPEEAVDWLRKMYPNDAEHIVKKWRYLKEQRPDFLIRYAPLFEYLGSQGAL